MKFAKQKSSPGIVVILPIFLLACTQAPVDFGLRINDPETGASIDCRQQADRGFAVVAPAFVEQNQSFQLRYPGGGQAKWKVVEPHQSYERSGSELSLRVADVGWVDIELEATNICLMEEQQRIRLQVLPAMSEPQLQIREGNFTNQAVVHLLHPVRGATEMSISSSPDCRGAWRALQDSSTYSLMARNQENHVYAKFRNPLRETRCVSASIIHDEIAPVLQLRSLPPVLSAQRQIQVGLAAEDTGSGVQGIYCRMQGEAYQLCQDSLQRSLLQEGEHEIWAYVVDRAGNTSQELSYRFRLDHSPPVISWQQVPARLSAPATLAFQAMAQQTEALNWRCQVNGRSVLCDEQWQQEFSREGTYEVRVSARDLAGNVSNELRHSFAIDATGPEIRWLQRPLDPSVESEAEFRISASDNMSGVAEIFCSLDGGPVRSCDDRIRYRDLAEGLHEFSVFAVDSLGNRGRSLIHRWEIDKSTVSEQRVVGAPVRKVDIVMVIDNSSSMEKEQREMAQKFTNFIESLEGLDWRVGIITTTVDGDEYFSGGRLQSFALPNEAQRIDYLDSGFTDAVQRFRHNVRRRERGSDNEQGIKAIRRFLEGDQQKILREEAHFTTSVVSDEDERSNGRNLAAENKPENLLRRIEQLFQGQKNYSHHSIVWRPGDSSCGRRGGRSEAFTYAGLSAMTDGILGDICAQDYSSQLLSIGDRIQETAFSFSLKCIPRDLNGDGVGDVCIEFTPNSATETYQLRGNKIFFDRYPAEGTQLHLVYRCNNFSDK